MDVAGGAEVEAEDEEEVLDGATEAREEVDWEWEEEDGSDAASLDTDAASVEVTEAEAVDSSAAGVRRRC